MRDPDEGISAAGVIETGARRERIAGVFKPVLDQAVQVVQTLGDPAALYLYGSVATGQARVGASDVDLLTIDVDDDRAASLATDLSHRFRSLCRAVEISSAHTEDLENDTDEAYGNKVFLRHYCVHLVGPIVHPTPHGFAADVRAARGFNGDIAQHARKWRSQLDAGIHQPPELARRVARKTLLAVAGLVSIHDHAWTTDRESSARRWGEIEPSTTAQLQQLVSWTDSPTEVTVEHLTAILDGVVADVVDAFASTIGLWPETIAPAGQ